jgi:hypothetical protein
VYVSYKLFPEKAIKFTIKDSATAAVLQTGENNEDIRIDSVSYVRLAFKEPVRVTSSSSYTIHLTYPSDSTVVSGSGEMTSVTVQGVTFKFTPDPFGIGQIPALLFVTPDADRTQPTTTTSSTTKTPVSQAPPPAIFDIREFTSDTTEELASALVWSWHVAAQPAGSIPPPRGEQCAVFAVGLLHVIRGLLRCVFASNKQGQLTSFARFSPTVEMVACVVQLREVLLGQLLHQHSTLETNPSLAAIRQAAKDIFLDSFHAFYPTKQTKCTF